MPTTSRIPLDHSRLREEFGRLGVREGSTVIVHSSLASFGPISGGANTVVDALLDCLTASGTLAVPTFTPEISDPHPQAADPTNPSITAARDQIPLFHDTFPTTMGAIPTAILARPARLRSAHPQASVAAIGPHAQQITQHQPLAYAVGTGSPFDTLHGLDADILLLGVGHNRNSFLHYAETLVPHHRRKLRRFPYRINQQRVWVEAEDVGDDNGTYFPQVGDAFNATAEARTRTIGHATCHFMNSRALTRYATKHLAELLLRTPAADAGGQRTRS
ncbi:aminoglycoside N(3)-acetyltransferase [Streptomyces sp. NPDC050485]|uniref:aminoglycoside N(3)-acetyltransferase n=1 Tax=Streptomyces sp. NPDC050485 TaxID=3365617 RepID=UPI0037BC61CD